MKEKFRLVSNERAVLVGAVLSCLSALAEFTVDGHVNWRSALPVVAGIVIRNFVYGPKVVNELDERVDTYDKILKEIIVEVNKAEAERQAPPAEDGAA